MSVAIRFLIFFGGGGIFMQECLVAHLWHIKLEVVDNLGAGVIKVGVRWDTCGITYSQRSRLREWLLLTVALLRHGQ